MNFKWLSLPGRCWRYRWKHGERAKALASRRTMIIIVCHIMAQLKHAPLSSFSPLHTPWMWFLRCGNFFNVALSLVRNDALSVRRQANWLKLSLSRVSTEWHHQHRYTRTDGHNLWLTIVVSISPPQWPLLSFDWVVLFSVVPRSSLLCVFSFPKRDGNCGNIGNRIVIRGNGKPGAGLFQFKSHL